MELRYYRQLLDSFTRVSENIIFELSEDLVCLKVFARDPSRVFYPKVDFIGQSVYEVLPPDLAAQVQQAFATAKESGTASTIEYPSPYDNRWFRGTSIYAAVEEGAPFYLFAVTDISDEKNSRDALRFHADFDTLLVHATSTLIQSSEENFDTSLEQVLQRIGSFAGVDRAYYFSFAHDGTIMNNTHEWCSEGVSAEKDNLQGIPCAIFPEWMKRLRNNEAVYIPDVNTLPASWQAEREILEPQGVQSLLALPVKAQGRLYGFIGFDAVHSRVVWDQSKRQLLSILADNLGSVIMRNEQSQHLRQATEQAQILAREATLANRHKSDFLANMSHEIRTPLNGVVGFTELLMETGLTELQRQYIDKVRTSAQSLLELINQVLDFSKIEAGKMDLDIDRSDLVEVVETTCSLVRPAASNKQVELILDLDPAIPRHFLVDAVRLQQILANLMGNAVKFTEKGSVTLAIRCHCDAATGMAQLQFAVTDTGIGIAEEHRRHIFQAFAQADIYTTRKYGGTGLGLAISNSLLHMMNSRLELESTLGVGSTFSFSLALPFFEGQAFSKENNTRFRKALVVDDNGQQRAVIGSWLRHRNIEVLEAKGASEALTLLALHTNVDLALIDEQMPIIQGRQLAALIRTELLLPAAALPILMLCTHGECLSASQQNPVPSLSKPLIPSELYQALEQLQQPETAFPTAVPSPVVAETPATAARAGKKILIAEDNATNLLYIRILVERAFSGCEVMVARNGVEAISQYKAARPDLVLMDIQMPEMDGDQATLVIRQLEAEQQSKHIPIVALTAHAIKGVKEQYLAAGFDDYLSKPASMEDVQRLLEKYA